MKEKFDVLGMTCAACQAHVEKAVKKLDGVKTCDVNLLLNNMNVEFDDKVVSKEDIVDAVSKAGYSAKYKDNQNVIKEEKDYDLVKLIISFIFLILLMYFSMGVMMWHFPTFDCFSMKNPIGFSLIQFILLLPILYLERGYFIRGFKVLFKGPTMDSLIAVGASASLIYSVVMLFMITYDSKYHMSLYFEASGMILVFVSLGKYLEKISKKKTTKSIEALMDLSPKTANVLKDGNIVKVLAEEVLIGDIVVCKKGDLVPIDGNVIKGSGYINEANITGESIPSYKKDGDLVYSSTIVESGYLEVRANAVGNDTNYSNIINLVKEASNSKAKISNLADKISFVFVPVVFIISLIVFIFNFIYVMANDLSYASNAFNVAFNFAVTILVIACPCALGLATPVAIMVGMGVGARNGLIIKNASILEKTGKIDTVVLDKTGTITKGLPVVSDFLIDKEEIDNIYALELLSSHPLSKAIVNYLKDKVKSNLEVLNYTEIDGVGIEGEINNHKYYLGNINGIKNKDNLDYSNYAMSGKTVIYYQKDDKFIGILTIRDEIKENSIKAIKALKDSNINVIMLTGDNKITANAIGKEIGIDNVIANVTPKDKASVIEKLKSEGHFVSMVGDGVNDAVALTTSDLGIAIGAGADVALETADIVLVRNDLEDVYNAIRLSRRVLLTIKIGLFWAFFYNLICIFLASGIIYHITNGAFQMKPEYGSILMSISSVSVVLNALSINLFKVKRNKEEKKEEKIMDITIQVEGMMCKNCKAHVEKACMEVSGVENAVASLENKNVVVTLKDESLVDTIKEKINEAGYEVK